MYIVADFIICWTWRGECLACTVCDLQPAALRENNLLRTYTHSVVSLSQSIYMIHRTIRESGWKESRQERTGHWTEVTLLGFAASCC